MPAFSGLKPLASSLLLDWLWLGRDMLKHDLTGLRTPLGGSSVGERVRIFVGCCETGL